MCEETKRNPADLNGDGKVTLKEQIQYAAMQAKAKAGEVAEKVKESEAYAKACVAAEDFKADAREALEKTRVQAEELATKVKESETFNKACDKAGQVAAKVKEDARQAYEVTKAQAEELSAKAKARMDEKSQDKGAEA